jgi:hypothetical protein
MNFDEIVTVKTRTGKDEEFTFDSRPFIIDAKKGIKVSRFMADAAVAQNALRWNPGTGLVEEAMVYVEDDEVLPSTPITADEINEIKQTDGLGEDSMIIDGKIVKKTRINLKPRKEDFSHNNIG